MLRFSIFFFTIIFSLLAYTENSSDEKAIERAARDYIKSQHKVLPELMKRGLHKKLVKRTFWENKNGEEFVMETDYELMLKLASTYNVTGEKFPSNPKIGIKILDIDQRVANVKLTVDDNAYPIKGGVWVHNLASFLAMGVEIK